MVKSFSISWKRNRFEVKLFCFAPSGKEHVTKVFLTPHSMQHLAMSMLKAVREQKIKVLPKEDESADYFG